MDKNSMVLRYILLISDISVESDFSKHDLNAKFCRKFSLYLILLYCVVLKRRCLATNQLGSHIVFYSRLRRCCVHDKVC